MAKEIKIPEIAEGVESATVSEVLVSEGDEVKKEQALITVESDKASVEIPSPENGTVKSVKVSTGDEVSVGDVIVMLEASSSDSEDDDESEKQEDAQKEKASDKSDDSDSDKKDTKEEDESKDAKSEEDESEENDSKEDEGEEKPKDSGNSEKEEKESRESEEDESEKSEESDEGDETDKESQKSESKESKSDSADESPQKSSTGNVAASPAVRRLARELGVDIQAVADDLDNEHISEGDVKAFAKKQNTSSGPAKAKTLSLPDFEKWGKVEKKPLSGIRATTAKNVSAAWSTIPHVFQFDEAEIAGIEKYIDEHKEKAEKAGGKLTITAVLVKVAAVALREFPKFNASIDLENEVMILKKYIHIGIAVDTEKGLLVPVVKNADQKSIIEISAELSELSEKARDGKLSHEEMQGGTFTISNLGGIGGTNFTPIVYHPQVAILGVSRAAKKPVFDGDKFEPRDMLPLSLSYDHRIIDGAEGVRFIDWVARALEDPYSALLGA